MRNLWHLNGGAELLLDVRKRIPDQLDWVVKYYSPDWPIPGLEIYVRADESPLNHKLKAKPGIHWSRASMVRQVIWEDGDEQVFDGCISLFKETPWEGGFSVSTKDKPFLAVLAIDPKEVSGDTLIAPNNSVIVCFSQLTGEEE